MATLRHSERSTRMFSLPDQRCCKVGSFDTSVTTEPQKLIYIGNFAIIQNGCQIWAQSGQIDPKWQIRVFFRSYFSRFQLGEHNLNLSEKTWHKSQYNIFFKMKLKKIHMLLFYMQQGKKKLNRVIQLYCMTVFLQ